MKIGSEKVFLDTAPFIYWLENHPVYYSKVERYIIQATTEDLQFITSVLTYMEYSVKPDELGRRDLIDDFLELTVALNCPLMPVTFDVSTKAFQLRAAYKSLKAMDALQLATAIINDCRTFVTNDKRLKVIAELDILVLDEIV